MVLWDAPWSKVATIRSRAQRREVSTCETLFFSPWNTIDDHRPLGHQQLAIKAELILRRLRAHLIQRREFDHDLVAITSSNKPFPIINHADDLLALASSNSFNPHEEDSVEQFDAFNYARYSLSPFISVLILC